MKGITSLIAIVAILALVLVLFNRPGSIIDDCSRISSIPTHISYSSYIESSIGNLWGNTNIATEQYAVVIDNAPSNAEIQSAQTKVTITRVTDGANNMWVGSTSFRDAGYGRCPIQKAYIISGGGEIQSSLSDRRVEGYYDVSYIVKFKEIAVTPALSPTPTSGPIYSIQPILVATPVLEQDNRIFILSDVFDAMKSIIAGIVTFVLLPFIPP